MKETDCRKCCVCAFKESLCEGDFCEKYYREGSAEDFEKLLPHWIPCSERLPQPNEEEADGFIKAYLVQDGRWMDVARWNGDCWIAWGYGTALTNVIAWMPLPEPYKERRQDG